MLMAERAAQFWWHARPSWQRHYRRAEEAVVVAPASCSRPPMNGTFRRTVSSPARRIQQA